MKKYLVFIMLLIAAFAMQAQDRSLTDRSFSTTQTYYEYVGVAADTLTAGQDSIDFEFTVNKEYPVQLYIASALKRRAGADTTVTVYLYGRVFNTEAYSLISSTASTLTTDQMNIVTTVSEPSYTMAWDTTGVDIYTNEGTVTAAAIANYYRQFKLVYVIAGNDAVGTGVKITGIKVKVWRREF
jgi:hypothetical protein